MRGKLFYAFPGEGDATIAEVGGKGYSLTEGARASLPVPPGFILTTHFFEPWIEKLQKSKAWPAFISATDAELESATAALKKAAARFTFTPEQSEVVAEQSGAHGSELFAVRSSSPNEDLEGASFAGGYETVLGVTREKLEAAVRKCFISCLDYRVAVYMRQSGFDWKQPKIAVVVQRQIESEVAGVGFSLNPVTNNYDEAVFNANWGLGETVVGGVVTPDTFIVDTAYNNIIEKKVGSKELSVWLTHGGGTEEKKGYKSAELTLLDWQIFALTELVKKVEEHYEKPMDIEWAYAEGKLYLLQARPITAYVPLSPEMITAPKARKRLYFDISITAEGMTKPISYMGTSGFRQLLRVVGKTLFLRDITKNIDTAIAYVSDGRIFANLSTFFKLVGQKYVTEVLTNMDTLAVKAIAAVDEKTYLPNIPKWRLLPYGVLLRLPMIVWYVLRAKRQPERILLDIRESCTKFTKEVKELTAREKLLAPLVGVLVRKLFLQIFIKTLPLVLASRTALSRMERAANGHPDTDKLTRAIPRNITVEMSLALAKLAEFVPGEMSKEELQQNFKEKRLPKAFMHEWETFIELYGMRGPEEVDLAAPRYSDTPELLLNLLYTIKHAGGESAQALFDRNRRERQATYTTIYQQLLAKDRRAARQFAADYRFFEAFGGYRETHKYYLIVCIGLVREKILSYAKQLVEKNRLDAVEQVFDLSLEELDDAMTNEKLDLRKLAGKNTVFLKKLARVPRAPAVIDSRGLIPRAPAPAARAAGEVAGTPISSGIVRGKIKVLRTPDEKPFLKGEILVARATDPGWTPLFVNAAGVILEVGGILQHGALVAREYGLPCVAGIENATSLWKDGTMVEIDGATGIVRTVSE